MISKCLVLFSIFVVAHFQKVQAQNISCYSCFYDKESSTLPDSEEECVKKDFDGNGIGTTERKTFCLVSKHYMNGDPASVFRGSNLTSLYSFITQVSRNINGYITYYCDKNLCNSV